MRRRIGVVLIACAAVCAATASVHAQSRGHHGATSALPRHHPLEREALAPATAAMPGRPPAVSVVAPTEALPGMLINTITLASVGFNNGVRFANLGGRRDIFIPVPQGPEITARELVLTLDDISAHEARRSLEILANDRSAAAIALDGNSTARTVRIPLHGARAREGFLKLTFQYSGAATPDRCIDVRYVGDSLTIRPESAIELGIDFGRTGPDIATTAALLPHDVSIVLPGARLTEGDVSTALTVARALAASGRRIDFKYGLETLPFLTKRDQQHWTRGIVIVGSQDGLQAYVESWPITVAGPAAGYGTIAAAKVNGEPVLLVASDSADRAARLLGRPAIAATRGVEAASVGEAVLRQLTSEQVRFDQLGIELPQAAVFGRAELKAAIDRRLLPPDTRPKRLLIDVMVAPDGSGEKAVVSAYVNEQLLASKVAATGEPTRFDIPLPDGLVGLNAGIRILVQRRSAQGDCRFEPQGYPADMLGSSAVVLEKAVDPAVDFNDLSARWANGVEVLLPATAIEQPAQVMKLTADMLTALAPETARIKVKFVNAGSTPAPTAPFLAIGHVPPAGSGPHVRFDRGRVVVTDRAGKRLLDLGGFGDGTVAQVITANSQPGLWIKPLAADGTLPAPGELRLDRGNVAFIDKTGLALAMSTERDTLVRIAYPDQVSWFMVADRFRSWIMAAFWLLATFGLLFVLQRFFRRRADASSDAAAGE